MCIPGNFIFSPKIATGSQNSPRRRTKQVHHGNRATTPQATLKIRRYHRYYRPYVLYMTSTICVHRGIELGPGISSVPSEKTSNIIIRSVIDDAPI